MTTNTVSEKKPTVHLTVRIEKSNYGWWMSKVFRSEAVSSELVPQAIWKLEVGRRIENGGGYTFVHLYLAGPMVDNEEDFYASYHLYFIDGSGGKIDVDERDSFNFGKEGKCLGGRVNNEKLKTGRHADGSLVVAADVWFPVPNDERSSVKSSKLHSDKASMDHNSFEIAEKSALHTNWHNSIDKLRETGIHSDCTLMVGGEELKAHRLVLSAISPIFEKMFGNGRFQEAKDGIVRIEDPPGMLKDSTAKPYQALLSFAYSGCVDWSIFGDCKWDVLVVACKYLVLDLKHHVERQLAREITTESLAELALLADTYSCDQLKKACFEFLSYNCLAVVLTPQWGDLTETRGDLAKELLRLVREGKATASTTTAGDGGGTK